MAKSAIQRLIKFVSQFPRSGLESNPRIRMKNAFGGPITIAKERTP